MGQVDEIYKRTSIIFKTYKELNIKKPKKYHLLLLNYELPVKNSR